MVIPTRFERVAYRLGICRSILLSYGIAGVSLKGNRFRFEGRIALPLPDSACMGQVR